jgi:hypothetical protein
VFDLFFFNILEEFNQSLLKNVRIPLYAEFLIRSKDGPFELNASVPLPAPNSPSELELLMSVERTTDKGEIP